MKDDLWARVRGLGSITWKGCDWVELLVVQTRHTGSSVAFLISSDVLGGLILLVFYLATLTCVQTSLNDVSLRSTISSLIYSKQLSFLDF